ncbi:MAG TPA: hypothetical protein VFZ48_04145 [Candidatus Saccharimonadales bacterium]
MSNVDITRLEDEVALTRERLELALLRGKVKLSREDRTQLHRLGELRASTHELLDGASSVIIKAQRLKEYVQALHSFKEFLDKHTDTPELTRWFEQQGV